uniref:Uncharacterized protein n=1 Tax=Cacopsylla melanoneura TaxID=428564 RepID=A0A8D8YKY2_9HEMI
MSDNTSADQGSKNNPWYDEADEKIFSKFEFVGGKFIPPQAEFLKHLENYSNGQEFKLQWKCIGRRAPTPENEETNEHDDDQFDHVENTIDDKDFEFEDELNQLNLSSVRRNATPKGSAKKTKTNSLQSILSNIARHRKIDMLGTEDELKNKMKQEQQKQSQLETANQLDMRHEHQLLGDENLSQSSGSQPLHETIDLQNNEIESSSNSQLNEPSQTSYPEKDETSLEGGLHHFTMDSTDANQHSTSQSGDVSSLETNPSNHNQPTEVQLGSDQVGMYQNQLPQSNNPNNLSFQNILNRNSEANTSSSHQSSVVDSLGSIHTSSANSVESNTNTIMVTQADLILNQSSQVTTSSSSNSGLSHSQKNDSTKQMGFDSIGMKHSEMEHDQTQTEMLETDLPLPDEAKQDLSEFDFQMDE